MPLSIISPESSLALEKTPKQVLFDCTQMIGECFSQGDYINPYPADNLAEKEDHTNSHLLVKYDGFGNLLGCLMMTDKDHYVEGFETKEFLLERISEIENIALPADFTKIFWISSVCTSPDSRKSGCASSLFEHAEKIALDFPSTYTIIAEAVRAVNDVMLGFSEHKGYKSIPKPLTEKDFGLEMSKGSLPWVVLYKFLRVPEPAL